MWQKKPLPEPVEETFTCPACHLVLRSKVVDGRLTLDYHIVQWRKNCPAARAGTPCVCPQFRPRLWQMLVRANQASAKG